MQKSQSGFTIIELLMVIGLLILSVGVTTDIIITLVRSYNKTQVSNEIEQNANFVFLKLEKELRNAAGASVEPPSGNNSHRLIITTKEGTSIQYYVDLAANNRIMWRQIPPAAADQLTNNDAVNGVDVTCPTNQCFQIINTNPTVVQINIAFSQRSGGVSSPAFTGSVDLSETIVVRGTY